MVEKNTPKIGSSVNKAEGKVEGKAEGKVKVEDEELLEAADKKIKKLEDTVNNAEKIIN